MRLAVPHKPRLRGLTHHYGVYLWTFVGIGIVWHAPPGPLRVATAVYAVTIWLMLGASAVLHRGEWSVEEHRRLTQLDHTMIFLAIAGTFTPFMVAADTATATRLLRGVWLATAAGIALEWLPFRRPRGYVTGVFFLLGLLELFGMGQIRLAAGSTGLTLVLVSMGLYAVGALVHAYHWPDPDPEVFGYHEIWHVCVLVALVLHTYVIAFCLDG